MAFVILVMITIYTEPQFILLVVRENPIIHKMESGDGIKTESDAASKSIDVYLQIQNS